jgi:hypothetical protein
MVGTVAGIYFPANGYNLGATSSTVDRQYAGRLPAVYRRWTEWVRSFI